MEEEVRELAVDELQTLYGHTNTTKFHRLAQHLGEEMRARGNLREGETSVNEKLHGACKRMFKRSNIRGPGVALQIMRCSEAQSAILQEILDAEVEDACASPFLPLFPIASRVQDLDFVGVPDDDTDGGATVDDGDDSWGTIDPVAESSDPVANILLPGTSSISRDVGGKWQLQTCAGCQVWHAWGPCCVWVTVTSLWRTKRCASLQGMSGGRLRLCNFSVHLTFSMERRGTRSSGTLLPTVK